MIPYADMTRPFPDENVSSNVLNGILLPHFHISSSSHCCARESRVHMENRPDAVPGSIAASRPNRSYVAQTVVPVPPCSFSIGASQFVVHL